MLWYGPARASPGIICDSVDDAFGMGVDGVPMSTIVAVGAQGADVVRRSGAAVIACAVVFEVARVCALIPMHKHVPKMERNNEEQNKVEHVVCALHVLPGWRMNVNAKLVVGLPLLLIGEHLIGLRHLLEILLRELLVFARVFVRVVLDGELLVRCAQRQHTDSA